MSKEPTATTGKLMVNDLSIGQKFQSAKHVVTAEEIKAFAAKYDPQPFHLDEEAAVDSFFGKLVASGWHTAAMSMNLIVRSLPIHGGLIGASSDMSWTTPVNPGDTLNVESEVIDIRVLPSHPQRGIVTIRSTTFNQDGTSVMSQKSKLVVPRRT